ncbi:MAG: molecular chaperone [Magnetovibrio sp.]|nr:molecular chaperone [Magnetovibrio sp.]
MNNHFISLLTATVFAFLGLCVTAQAGTGITPPRVTLTADNIEGVLTITNDRDVAAGYDIEALGWEQEDDGKVLLPPTKGIRVEPSSLDIPAHGSAQIHITALVPAPESGHAEKVYRLRIIERGDRKREDSEKDVQVISSFTIPVFQKPLETAHIGRLTNQPLADGTLNFTVHNSGTEHTYVGEASVTGKDAKGVETFRIKRQGWYVLANGRLTFKAALSGEDCRSSRTITLAARVLESDETWVTDITPDPAQCGDGTVSEFPTGGLKKMPVGFKPGDQMPGGLKPLPPIKK